MAKTPDEAADINLVEDLIFRPCGLVLEPFTREETARSKTPDRRVFRAGELAAYTEIKSPRDDWFGERLAAARPGTMVGGARLDPVFNRIARHIQNAASQFDAVNPRRHHPNILVLVNHARQSDYRDLLETVTGVFRADTGERFPTMKHISDQRIARAKRRIDLCAWIDGRRRRIEGYLVNEATEPDYKLQLCGLLGIDPAKIMH